MALFRRKKTEKPVNKEVEQYIKAEKRERAGLAWLLALVSLAVVSLLVLGLFFGGKWAYKRINKDNDTATTQTETQTSDDKSQDGAQTSTPESDDKKEESSSTDTSDATDEADTEESSDEEVAVADDEKEDMPQTGPSQPYVLAALIAIISTVLYRLRLKRLN